MLSRIGSVAILLMSRYSQLSGMDDIMPDSLLGACGGVAEQSAPSPLDLRPWVCLDNVDPRHPNPRPRPHPRPHPHPPSSAFANGCARSECKRVCQECVFVPANVPTS